VEDSIKARDIASIVDCMNKFYTALGAISAAILGYNGILTEQEVFKYLTTITEIEKEFRKSAMELAEEASKNTK
jgi:hypothetical protein